MATGPVPDCGDRAASPVRHLPWGSPGFHLLAQPARIPIGAAAHSHFSVRQYLGGAAKALHTAISPHPEGERLRHGLPTLGREQAMVGGAVQAAAILHGEPIDRLQPAADHIRDLARLEDLRGFI